MNWLKSLSDFAFLYQKIFQLPAMPLDATERHPPVWTAVLGGAGLGLGWGIVARLWMRLITTTPEFSIPGRRAYLSSRQFLARGQVWRLSRDGADGTVGGTMCREASW